MFLLILGLALWWGAHSFKAAAPAKRAALDAKFGAGPARGIMAAAILLSVILMVIGYQRADFIDIWYPPEFLRHLNNLLMLIAIALMGARDVKSNLRRFTRHPMLNGLKLWALAHLLVNGDLASIVLFGGLLAWGVFEMIRLNKRDGAWVKPEKTPMLNEVKLVVGTLVIYGVIGYVHGLVGPSPFPG